MDIIRKRLRKKKIGAAIGASLGLGLAGLAGAYVYKKRNDVMLNIGKHGYNRAKKKGSEDNMRYYKKIWSEAIDNMIDKSN
jgi:hypothetical protein